MKKLSLFLAIAFLIVGCQSSLDKSMYGNRSHSPSAEAVVSADEFSIENEDAYDSAPHETSASSSKQVEFEKTSKIIKVGNMKIEVEDLISAKRVIDVMVQRHNAYYEKEILRNSEYTSYYSLKIRMPSVNFNDLVMDLEKGKGIILEKNINAKDVTEEFLDLEIRLKNNKAYLKRYNELLAKANTIEEMIKIQEKVRQIELLVDSNRGRLTYLGDKVKYSTLSIELSEKPEAIIVSAQPTYAENIISGFKNGLSGIGMFFLFLVNIWPVFLIILLVWVIRKRLYFFMFKGMEELK